MPQKSFELQPHLTGELLELRPLRPEDWDGLFQAAADPKIWEQHPCPDRYQEGPFKEFFRGALESGGAFVVIDRQTNMIIGSSRYCGYDPEHSEIEIGWTFLAYAYWGGKYNAELKRLMLDHAFKFVDSVIFLVGATNTRSQRAMEKIGGVLTDRRIQKTVQGNVIDHVVFQIKKPATFMR